MKSLSALLVLFQFIGAQGAVLALSPSAHASEFFCQEIYQRKLQRIYSHKDRRRAAEVGGILGFDAALTALVYGLTGSKGATITLGSLSTIVALEGLDAVDPFGRTSGLESSNAIQKLMFIPYQVLFDKECARRKDAFNESFTRLNEQEKRLEILRWTTWRVKNDLPLLSDAETIQFASDHQCANLSIQNEIEALRKETEFSTYEELRLFMLKNQDVFCPDGKALTASKVAKNIKVRKVLY